MMGRLPLCRGIAGLCLLGAARVPGVAAEAAPLYDVTDITAGNVPYTWNKVPVNYLKPDVESGWLYGSEYGYYEKDADGTLHNPITIAKNAYGSIWYEAYTSGGGRTLDSVFGGYTWYNDDGVSPVSDFNIHGQVVGSTWDESEAMVSLPNHGQSEFLN